MTTASEKTTCTARAAELAGYCRQRTETYELFARIIDREVNDDARAMVLAACEGLPEEADVTRGLRGMAAALTRFDADFANDLACDYARTFLAAGIYEGTAAVPYESVYTSETHLLMQEARDEVRAIFRAARVMPNTEGDGDIPEDCRKRAEYNLELARYDFAVPSTLQDEEIEAVLERADELVNWAGDVKEYALQQALSGKQWDGWKLVEGRSNRRYVNEEAVAEAVEKAGFNPYEKKLLGITAMTKQLGKKRFEELLSDLVEKPQGKPVLVPASDKRPAMYTAADEFNDEK